MLAALPNIGVKKSQKLAKEHSLAHLFQMNKEGWITTLGKPGAEVYDAIWEEPT